MKETPYGTILSISNNETQVKCPCGHINTIKRCHTDEGIYIQICKKCDERFKYVVDKAELYGDNDA